MLIAITIDGMPSTVRMFEPMDPATRPYRPRPLASVRFDPDLGLMLDLMLAQLEGKG